MIINPQVPFHRLVLSLSEALDSAHPEIADHQQRVSYIVTAMARKMGFEREALVDTFHAAALHDIGLIGVERRCDVLQLGQLESAVCHGEIGCKLLSSCPIFAASAEMVHHHHIAWNEGRGAEENGRAVPLGSHIISLADSVERMIDRAGNILQQAPGIVEKVVDQSGKRYHPQCVEAFRQASVAEAFWLDAVSPRIYSVLLRQMDWPTLILDEQAVGPIAKMFSRIVDAASAWMMVHTAGVAVTAVELARLLDFSPRELHLMRAAGYLHDLGKLTVPTQILDKPGKLDKAELAIMRAHTYHTFRILDNIGGMPQISEWAAFHHERLNGCGYPFHHAGRDLTLGSRILAVSDVFTAIMEDRPYRKAMRHEEAFAVLDKLARDGALDGDLVAVARRECDKINEMRRSEQAEYGREQEEMGRLLKSGGQEA